jgi:hypothetical protein
MIFSISKEERKKEAAATEEVTAAGKEIYRRATEDLSFSEK